MGTLMWVIFIIMWIVVTSQRAGEKNGNKREAVAKGEAYYSDGYGHLFLTSNDKPVVWGTEHYMDGSIHKTRRVLYYTYGSDGDVAYRP